MGPLGPETKRAKGTFGNIEWLVLNNAAIQEEKKEQKKKEKQEKLKEMMPDMKSQVFFLST